MNGSSDDSAGGGSAVAVPELPFTLKLLPLDKKDHDLGGEEKGGDGCNGSAVVAPHLLVSPLVAAPANAHASSRHFFTAPRVKVAG